MLCSEYKKRVKAAQTAQEKAKKKVLAGMAPHKSMCGNPMLHACMPDAPSKAQWKHSRHCITHHMIYCMCCLYMPHAHRLRRLIGLHRTPGRHPFLEQSALNAAVAEGD